MLWRCCWLTIWLSFLSLVVCGRRSGLDWVVDGELAQQYIRTKLCPGALDISLDTYKVVNRPACCLQVLEQL